MTRVNPVPGSAAPLPADADELTRLLHAQAHVLTRWQAMRHLSAKTVWHRIRSGRWQAAHTGVYVAHSGPITREQRRWIAVLAAGRGGPAVLGGTSALEVLGLRGPQPPGIHVVIPAGRHHRDPPPGVVVHRTRTLAPVDIHRVGRPPCTMPARSVIDAARWAATDDRARAIVAAAFEQRLVARADVEEALSRLRRVRRRELIVATGRAPLRGRAPRAVPAPEPTGPGGGGRSVRPGPGGTGRPGRTRAAPGGGGPGR